MIVNKNAFKGLDYFVCNGPPDRMNHQLNSVNLLVSWIVGNSK